MSDKPTRKTILSTDQIERIKAMRAEGISYSAITRVIGASHETIKRAVDPGYAEMRAQQIRDARWRRSFQDGGRGKAFRRETISTDIDADARRLMDAVPVDTRSLTGRLFGDPIPGRSALDHK